MGSLWDEDNLGMGRADGFGFGEIYGCEICLWL